MRSVFYSFPRKSQWVRDSKLGWRDSGRRQDKVLLGIDDMVQAVSETVEPQQLTYLYCELYFATNFWLRNFEANRTMNGDRETAIRALHVYVELLLMRAFQCPHRMLRARLQKFFGKILSPHGVWCDRRTTYTKGQFETFRIVFESGRAYSLDWRTAMRQPAAPVPVDTLGPLSTDDYGGYINAQTDTGSAYAFFVLTFDRDMYIAPHCDTQDLLPDYHSSYT
jgi:hypothetical protein